MSRASLALLFVILFPFGDADAQASGTGYRLHEAGDVSESPPSDAQVAANLLTPMKRERCVPSDGESIVVCAHNPENDRQKLPVPDNPDTSNLTADGAPRAPNVSGLRDCSRGCIGIGKTPVPMYYFDIRKLPEAPAGSEADRIAKGELRAP